MIRNNPGEGGYTLLELIVVLAIISLLLGLFSTSMTRHSSLSSPKLIGKLIETDLEQARATAMSTGKPVDVLFDAERHIWRTGAGAERRWPDDVNVDLRTVSFATTAGKMNGIRFLPEGSSTGGEIALRRESQVVSVKVDWLTGRIGMIE